MVFQRLQRDGTLSYVQINADGGSHDTGFNGGSSRTPVCRGERTGTQCGRASGILLRRDGQRRRARYRSRCVVRLSRCPICGAADRQPAMAASAACPSLGPAHTERDRRTTVMCTTQRGDRTTFGQRKLSATECVDAQPAAAIRRLCHRVVPSGFVRQCECQLRSAER